MSKSRRRPSVPRTGDLSRHIFAKHARCKLCRSIDLHTTKTIGRDGDCVSRYVTCRRCGEQFVLTID